MSIILRVRMSACSFHIIYYIRMLVKIQVDIVVKRRAFFQQLPDFRYGGHFTFPSVSVVTGVSVRFIKRNNVEMINYY